MITKAMMLAIASTTVLTGCNPFGSPFVGACEDALRETLRSPSTYNRYQVAVSQRTITFEEYFKAHAASSTTVQKFQQQMAEHQPVQHVALIEYDAANAYGTPVRSTTTCTFETLEDDLSGATKTSVRIDDKRAR